MTDEEIFSVGVIEAELEDCREKLRMAERAIPGLESLSARQEAVTSATLTAFEGLVKAPIASLVEFRSLKAGLIKTREQHLKTRAELGAAQKTRSQMRAEIPQLEKKLADLQERLEQDQEPKSNVLEFKKNES